MCVCFSLSPFCLSGLSLSPASSQTQSVMRTVPYSTTATPRPALIPSSSRSQTPSHCCAAPPEKSTHAGLHSSSSPGLHLRPDHKTLSQSGVDSSGYSSSEGTYRKPTATTTSTSRPSTNNGAPSTGYKSRISSAILSLMGEYCSVCCVCYCLCVCLWMPIKHSYCSLCFVQTQPH